MRRVSGVPGFAEPEDGSEVLGPAGADVDRELRAAPAPHVEYEGLLVVAHETPSGSRTMPSCAASPFTLSATRWTAMIEKSRGSEPTPRTARRATTSRSPPVGSAVSTNARPIT